MDDGAGGTVVVVARDIAGLEDPGLDSVIPDIGGDAVVVLGLSDMPDPLTGAAGTTFGNFGM